MAGKKSGKASLPGTFTSGAIALIFLIIGYQTALFVHKAAALHLAANRDRPDTVLIYVKAPEDATPADVKEEISARKPEIIRQERKTPTREEAVVKASEKALPRKVESFPFDPNTVSVEDLQRLGFSPRQATAIDNYRQKGGRFRRREDFAKSFVVSPEVYSRLEPYIDIPKIDINKADSLTLLSLPGIGPWFASKILQYREALCGFTYTGQLMEIYHFDLEKFRGLEDLVCCSLPKPYPLWSLGEEELSKHPYIDRSEARGIVLFREHNPRERWSIEALLKNGVIKEEHAALLGKIRITTNW